MRRAVGDGKIKTNMRKLQMTKHGKFQKIFANVTLYRLASKSTKLYFVTNGYTVLSKICLFLNFVCK